MQNRSASTRAFICPHCGKPATATIRGITTRVGHPSDTPVEYSFVQCGECGDVSLEMREDYGDGFSTDTPVTIYPAQRRLSPDVPRPLRREFDEAQTCFTSKAYKATVVMVRRVLEGACQENNASAGTLVRKLARLKEDGVIDDTIAQWADALRVLGNEGAHYTGRRVSRDDAEDALAFAEALLDHIYVLRRRFEEFASRRERKRPSASEKT